MTVSKSGDPDIQSRKKLRKMLPSKDTLLVNTAWLEPQTLTQLPKVQALYLCMRTRVFSRPQCPTEQMRITMAGLNEIIHGKA